jgi:LysR family transcriptional regulator, hydrogen peroxide-inducible genes activator
LTLAAHQLTEQGEEIVRRGRTILASVRDLLDYAKPRERVLTGSFKLGAIPSIAPYLLPAALPEPQRRFPDLTLHLRETITETLIRELVSGDLDLMVAEVQELARQHTTDAEKLLWHHYVHA